MNKETLIYIDVYQSRLRKAAGRAQTWRWRAINGGNGRKQASSGEAYTNHADALTSAQELFGTESNVYLRQAEHGNVPLRLASWCFPPDDAQKAPTL